MLLTALVLSNQLIMVICTTHFRREKRNNVISYQLLSWKHIKESQCDVKQSIVGGSDCIDRYSPERGNIQSDEGVLLVYNGDNSLTKVCKCGLENKDISWNFDLVEEVDEVNKDHVRTLETITYEDKDLKI